MTPLVLSFLLLAVSLGLLWLGAEGLVRGGSSIARRFGLTPLVIGLTVVAYGTSTPELVVSVKAALAGQGDISVGNVVGSNIFNVAFILGLTVLIHPIRTNLQLLRFDVPVMIATAVAGVLVVWDGRLDRWEGLVLLAGIVAYTVMNVRLARRETAAVANEFDGGVPPPTGNALKDALFVLGGLGVLVLGSRLLVDSSVDIARTFGVSEAVIGLTIVAAGTSAPELAASLIAAWRKEPDIAIGNIVGSNIYNILAILGVSATVAPMQAPGISHVDLYGMLAVSLLLLPLAKSGFSLKRLEGLLLLACYGAFLWWHWPA
ncbi:calcium/sodium antiporter [Nibricoccus sp. IMCC34717]|uniref:calcium/sodium antiporter n=1 Tax=Nibricoccus sp. IMCC34717 TaxID=3034021 RepID=UPI00384B6CC2